MTAPTHSHGGERGDRREAIRFFTTFRHSYTITRFFEEWGSNGDPEPVLEAFEKVPFLLARGAIPVVFTDLERLIGPERRYARWIADAFRSSHPDLPILNDPGRVLPRFALLKELHRRGVNSFDVHRLAQRATSVRYPAFVKADYAHTGHEGSLVGSWDEALAQVSGAGRSIRALRRRLMLTEFVDVRSQDGLYRKYSAMRIGPEIIPRHVLFSDQWATKSPDVVTDELALEERSYVEDFPHETEVLEAFQIAGIDYGRIDYGVYEGGIEVWEINTNPMIVPEPDRIHPLRLESQRVSADRVMSALRRLAGGSTAEASRPRRRPLLQWSSPAWKTHQLASRLYGSRRL